MVDVRPLNPRAFLEIARSLAQNRDEASLRTAVNRAYYTAFLVARSKMLITGPRDVHSRVIRVLEAMPGQAATAQNLRALRRLRIAADYQMFVMDPVYQDWERNWHRAEQLANHILSRL